MFFDRTRKRALVIWQLRPGAFERVSQGQGIAWSHGLKAVRGVVAAPVGSEGSALLGDFRGRRFIGEQKANVVRACARWQPAIPRGYLEQHAPGGARKIKLSAVVVKAN